MAESVNITMAPDLLRAVQESVEAGEYVSTSAALSDAVRVWQRERADQAERLTVIKTRIRQSLDDPRPSLTSEEVRESLETMFAQARRDADRA